MNADYACRDMRTAVAWALRSVRFEAGALLVEHAAFEVPAVVAALLHDMERFAISQTWCWAMLERWRELWIATCHVPYESSEKLDARVKCVLAAIPEWLTEIPLPKDEPWSGDSTNRTAIFYGANLTARKDKLVWNWQANRRGIRIGSGHHARRDVALRAAEDAARKTR